MTQKTGWKHSGGKLLAEGPESLTDAELLAILIGTGMKGKPAEALATEILSKYGTLEQALASLASKPKVFKGIGKVKRIRLAAVKETLHRLFTEVYLKESIPVPPPPSLFQSEPSKPVSPPEEMIQNKEEIYFRANHLTIINTDFLTTNAIPENSVDFIVTSPPYNVDIRYHSFDDRIPYDVYLEFTQKWLEKAYRLLVDDGRFCLNIPLDKNKGGQQSVYADIVSIARKIGFRYHSTIVWNEQNISRRTAWGSWLSAAAPFVIAPVEMIAVLYKKRWRKLSGSRTSDISKSEFMEWTNGVWTFSGESKKRVGHPAPFPIELPRRCIKLFTYTGDTVLDPFLGSGSTLIACILTHRVGIGVEIDKNYCEIAKKRLIREAHIDQLRLEPVGMKK